MPIGGDLERMACVDVATYVYMLHTESLHTL